MSDETEQNNQIALFMEISGETFVMGKGLWIFFFDKNETKKR